MSFFEGIEDALHLLFRRAARPAQMGHNQRGMNVSNAMRRRNIAPFKVSIAPSLMNRLAAGRLFGPGRFLYKA